MASYDLTRIPALRDLQDGKVRLTIDTGDVELELGNID